MASDFTLKMRAKAALNPKKVVFPDSEDIRSLQASVVLRDEKIAMPILAGNKSKIEELAAKNNINLNGVEIWDIESSEWKEEFANLLFEKRKSKGMSIEEAQKTSLQPLYFAGLALELGKTDVVVGGSVSSTGDVMRAAIHTIGVKKGYSIVSSYFIMTKEDRLLAFSDCAVVPDPTDVQMADIGISTAMNFKAVTGEEPKVAMLSYSTKGSANSPTVEKVQNATKIAKEKAPELMIDGELQADAALIAAIGERKSPGSPVAGKANVLVFPNLEAGNIGYKLVERLAGYQAVGPFVQGLNKPYCDLSRGCSFNDIVDVAAICSLMA